MNAAHVSHPRLHALLGDAALDIAADLASEIEAALPAGGTTRPRVAFFGNMEAIRLGDCTDGQPWGTSQRGPTPHELAGLSRSLGGLAVVLELLHAAERTRVEGDDEHQVEEFVIDGLVLAARQLTTQAQGAVYSAG